MAGWACINNRQKLSDGVMGLPLSQKYGADLVQNCDLPPPQRLFSGPNKMVISSMNRICSMMVVGRDDNMDGFDECKSGHENENENLALLKALRRSQTRAREAERKAAKLVNERNCISNALIHESLQVFAYRQLVKLLEVQVSKLQSQCQLQDKKLCCNNRGRLNGMEGGRLKGGEDFEGEGEGGGVSWIVALAFCLGTAGVGIAFGCRYLF